MRANGRAGVLWAAGRCTPARLYACAVAVLAACSNPPPPPVIPAPEPEAPPPAAAPSRILAARAVAGNYRLRTDIQRANRAGRASPAARETPLRLLATRARTPDGMAGVEEQFGASLTIPGYTSGGRGTAQGASWWPVPGDSVVVMFTGQRGNRIQLRGAVDGTQIRGEVWFVSIETGNTFQLGSFTAEKQRR